MRRRATFVHRPEDAYNPNDVATTEGHLVFPGLRSAREERLTFGFNELSAEVVDVLKRSHQLHIKWASESPYSKISPYLSSLSPGLHVHFTPQEHRPNDRLCPILRKLFSSDLKCQSPTKSFTQPEILSTDFTSATNLQHYSLLPDLKQFVNYLQENTCTAHDSRCVQDVALLHDASYLDVDYDSISHALIVSAFWPMHDEEHDREYDWSLNVSRHPYDRAEIGILSPAQASEPEELQMEGFLLDVAEGEEPKPTVFFFPSRHHALLPDQAEAQAYSVSFDAPTGLHPNMRIAFASPGQLKEPRNKPADSTCALHAQLTLPSVLFADEYAFPTNLPDPLFQEAHNIVALRSISGEKDLETPDYSVDKWGSTLLLQLATPRLTSSSEWSVKIPLHLRYLNATAGGMQQVQIPWPVVFWACTAEEGTKFKVNPFDRINLGYDSLFGERTMFYHLEPRMQGNNTRLVETLSVPVLDTDIVSYSTVETVTFVVVAGGFLWLMWLILKGMYDEQSWWAARRKRIEADAAKKKE